MTDLEPAYFAPEDAAAAEDFALGHCGFVLAARDIMRALEGGPAACPRTECRKAGLCRNEQRGKFCAKELSPAAENMVGLMMLFAFRLRPLDIARFYLLYEHLGGEDDETPMQFDEETRAKFWPLRIDHP